MEKRRLYRNASLVKTKRGHVVNKWCGSCQYKEIQASSGGSSDVLRWCNKLQHSVEIDDICGEWKLEEKIAKI